jgi:uncharacterized protein YegJ (DUF2314 family)
LLWRAYRARKRREEERAPDSIVLLLANHAPLNPQYLSIVVSRAIGREIPALDMDREVNPAIEDPEAPAKDCVMGKAPHFMLSVDGRMFLVHSVPAPYADPAEFQQDFPELRTKAALERHTAWLSVDSMGREPSPEAHRVMGKVAAEFLGTDCLALYHPPTEKLIPLTADAIDALQAKLRGESPVQDLFGGGPTPFLPVIQIEDDDPRMIAAVKEARRRFPEFEAAFRAGGKGEFSVKTKLESGGRAEHIWVDVKRFENGRIFGVLGNEPVNLEGYRLGARIELDAGDVEDWCVTREGQPPVGAFTVAAIQDIGSKRN